jgi:hypothetical protein
MGDNGSLLLMENRRHIAVFSFYHQVAGYYFSPAIPGIYSNTENIVIWARSEITGLDEIEWHGVLE